MLATNLVGRKCRKRSATSRAYVIVAVYVTADGCPQLIVEDIQTGEMSTLDVSRVVVFPPSPGQ